MFELGITTEQIVGYLLVFARVGAWVWLTPPFGGAFLPPLVRVITGLAFALPMTPSAIAASGGISLAPVDLLLQFALQVAIGVALGLVCLTLLSAIQSAGAVIDVTGGFALASAYDPLMQQQASVISRVYRLLAGVLILVSGAYLIIMAGFSLTFEALPIGAGLSVELTAMTLTEALSMSFLATLQIAGPIIAILLIVDIGLGLLTRVAPTINLFVLSFPVKIGLTLLLVGVAIPQISPMLAGLTDASVDAMRGIAGGDMAENDSANKTEQPTPKKLKEGAKQGQVPRSTDIAAWTGLLALSFLLPLYIGVVSDELQQLLEMIPDVASEPSINRLTGIVWPGLIAVSLITVPLLVAILLVTQVSGWAQGGARPHLARIAPKTSKISPQQNGKRIFGTQGLWELVKQILKVTVIGLVLWIVITRTVEIVFGSGLLSLSTLAETAAAEGTRLVQVVIAAGLAIAIADYFVSQRRVRKQLMMSKREVKEEMKQSEGDPLLRAALRQRALEASRNRMMVDVAMADVVLVNPTHVSVALKYNQAMGAPRVVAKGAGVMAARIREIATENRVPLVEDVPLARALYRSCEIGTEIPADLYTAVARVLAFIMTLKKRGVHVGLHSARDVDRTVFI